VTGRFRVVLYCPDTHVSYDGRTPDEVGVGGGVTARVRLLKALAACGHEVTAYVNCPAAGVYDGVEYRPLAEAQEIRCDVLIANTTGGALDLTPVAGIPVQARLRLVWVGGVPKPGGLDLVRPDFIYVPSNFIRDVVAGRWGVPPHKIFVCYNGIDQAAFRQVEANPPARDPYGLVYLGHPSKGLQNALGVLRLLRAQDPRFHLDIYGGYEIWGQAPMDPPSEEGVNYHGLMGQRELFRRLFAYGFCLALQDVPEACGIGVQEAKRAGVIVVASAVGAFPELITHGVDGFLLREPPASPAAHRRAAELVLTLTRHPEAAEYIRRNGARTPWDWGEAARAMTAHWRLVLDAAGHGAPGGPALCGPCPRCGAALTLFPDGYRCLSCARFFPWAAPTVAATATGPFRPLLRLGRALGGPLGRLLKGARPRTRG
jgi:glycosyltransferase involved in cell wall biosynthesis